MSLEVKIPEDNLAGFSEQARTRLKEATVEFCTDLIKEANRIEAGSNSTSGPPEITRSMIDDAKVLVRRGLSVPKKSWISKILRVAAAALSLSVGIVYSETALQDSVNLVLYILLVAAAILAVTVSTLRE